MQLIKIQILLTEFMLTDCNECGKLDLGLYIVTTRILYPSQKFWLLASLILKTLGTFQLIFNIVKL